MLNMTPAAAALYAASIVASIEWYEAELETRGAADDEDTRTMREEYAALCADHNEALVIAEGEPRELTAQEEDPWTEAHYYCRAEDLKLRAAAVSCADVLGACDVGPNPYARRDGEGEKIHLLRVLVTVLHNQDLRATCRGGFATLKRCG